MSESSEYLRIRQERKARAAVTMEENAKKAKEAKAAAKNKAVAASTKGFDKALSEKRSRREQEWRRATSLPASVEVTEPDVVDETPKVETPAPVVTPPTKVEAPASAKDKKE